jgi:hypothetical protein
MLLNIGQIGNTCFFLKDIVFLKSLNGKKPSKELYFQDINNSIEQFLYKQYLGNNISKTRLL